MKREDRQDAWASGMFGPAYRENKNPKKIIRQIAMVIMAFFGVSFLLEHWSAFWISIKPTYDVEYLLENGASEGMHVLGEVTYTYDCFADMENYNDSRVTSYYYALPAAEGMMALSMPPAKHRDMEVLLEETMEYLNGGSWPASPVPIEGYVTKAQGRLPYLLSQYMLEIGYTQEEIDRMGAPLMIQYDAEKMEKARLYAPIGVILLALDVLLIAIPMVMRMFRKSR